MTEFKFYINDIEIGEPMGFKDLVFKVSRDKESHGVIFEASLSDLGFIDDAFDYLQDKKLTTGIGSDVVLKIDYRCDNGEFDNALTGKLDFRTYKERCGVSCIIFMSVEQKGCAMILKNRFNQKVDIDSNIAFDKMTQLNDYNALNFEMELPAVAIDARVEGYVDENGDIQIIPVTDQPGTDAFGMFIRPTYANQIFDSINTGQLIPASNYMLVEIFEFGLSPQLLFEDNQECFIGDFNYTFRFKGRFSINSTITGFLAKATVRTWNGEGELSDDSTIIESEDVSGSSSYTSDDEREFDITFTGTIALTDGLGLYGMVEFSGFDSTPQDFDISITFDSETYVNIYQTKLCPSTTANVNMINEVGSRIVEAVTDGCMRMKSDYYGRTDSQPIASISDGCGSLRVLLSGLKMRKALEAKFFLSFEDYFTDLKRIDNIGFGIETDELIPEREWVRVESIDHFYNDIKIIDIDHIPLALMIQDLDKYYSLIKVGYEKWEVERFNGLDEPNSKKEFRTSLKTIDNTLDIVSRFVSGSYPIEITRQQSFAATGGADTTYDNDTFIICVVRNGVYAYPYGNGYAVERGNIEDPLNLASPDVSTYYNWRIRPFYNLMRWAKSIFNSYVNIFDSTSKIFFASGEGNISATGKLSGTFCILENMAKAENKDLVFSDFQNAVDYLPITKPERIQFEYSLSIAEWKLIKANPYGYFNCQCGNGEFIKYYINELTYTMHNGKANFDLILKYQ